MSNAFASVVFFVVLCTTSATFGQAPTEPRGAAPSETSTTPPSLTSDPHVAYPAGAHGSVEVVLELVVDRTGQVREASVVEGAAPFAEAARSAALTWQFVPAMREGRAVAARVRFAVSFAEPESTEGEDPAMPAPSSEPAAPAPPPKNQPSDPVTVTVEGKRSDRTTSLNRAEVRELPGAFGDPFRAIEAMPGVTPIASGLPYFYVRGAPPGNVGYYFDGIRVPLLFHAAAGPSVIHPSFVDEVKLYPGAYPSRFGRFAGGIVTADASPPKGEFHGEANIRLIDAGGMVEVPFAGGRGNVAVAGRYSYTAAVVSLLIPDIDVGYWDYQARASYDLTPSDRIGVFAFGALDFLSQDDAGEQKTIYDTRFHRLDVRYDRRLSTTGRVRVAATIGDDRTNGANDAFTVRDRMRGARLEYEDRLGETALLRAGADVSQEKFGFDLNPSEGGTIPRLTPHTDLAGGARADVVWTPDARVTVVPGFRFDVFRAQGTTAFAPEPRVSARFRVSDDVALVNDFGIAHQLPSYVVPIPGFQPSLGNGLQIALQSSAGVEAKLAEDLTGTMTVFQNALLNTSDRLALARARDNDPTLDEDSRSRGRTIGLELLLKRKLTRRLGGFVAYTLSRSQRQIEGIVVPGALDRTHVLNVALAYDLGRGWRAGARSVFYTGVPATVAYVEAARHPPRTTPFYRFDWRVEKRWTLGPRRSWSLVFEMLNTTLHKEASAARCSAYWCKEETIGPVSAPSIGVEAVF